MGHCAWAHFCIGRKCGWIWTRGLVGRERERERGRVGRFVRWDGFCLSLIQVAARKFQCAASGAAAAAAASGFCHVQKLVGVP